ncbi:hypothetical protein WME94_36030 [Sorangium sp. So ce429]
MQMNVEKTEVVESPRNEVQQDESFELKLVDCGTNYQNEIVRDKSLPSCLSCFCGSGCFCGS